MTIMLSVTLLNEPGAPGNLAINIIPNIDIETVKEIN